MGRKACIVALCTVMALAFSLPALPKAPPDVQEIVRRSVETNKADWRAAPNYAFMEHDREIKNGDYSAETYEVIMLDGSPYERMISTNGHKLSAREETRELKKLRAELARRLAESSSARARRIAKYEKDRQQDHEMLQQMVQAFDYRLTGTGMMNGHHVYIVAASPRPGYVPPNRDTKVLTGMRGKMWIDQKTYQWVKVEAEVIHPVTFDLFLAKVYPGTRFILEQAPVHGDIWLPYHFESVVRSKILWFAHNSTDDERYSKYRPMREVAEELGIAPANTRVAPAAESTTARR